MDVYHKVEYKLEQAKWELDMLRSIQKRYDLGEAEDANDLQNWYYIEYLSGYERWIWRTMGSTSSDRWSSIIWQIGGGCRCTTA